MQVVNFFNVTLMSSICLYSTVLWWWRWVCSGASRFMSEPKDLQK